MMVGRGSGNQAHQIEMAEMRFMIKDLLWTVQALQQQETVEAHMENPKGGCGPFDMLEGGLEDDSC